MLYGNVSFRCYFPSNYTEHYQNLALADVPKWIECYKFTHPACVSISVKIWFRDDGSVDDEDVVYTRQ